MIRLAMSAAALACLAPILADGAMAQNAGGAPAADCPQPAPETTAALQGMRNTLLTPGARIDFAQMAASPGLQAARRAEEERKVSDWAYLCRYKANNAAARQRGRPDVVFIGASITENWLDGDPALFGRTILNRGIGGQTTSQLLLRFYQDVVELHPRAVHIMGGANDIAGNSGRITDEDYRNNISAMADIARANGVRVVIGSIPPTSLIPWQPSLRPAGRIAALNAWLRRYAGEHGFTYADYHQALATPDGGLRPELGADGVHPNRNGYRLMRSVAEQAIARALVQRPARR